jgi:hypothetical protein
LEKLYVKFSRKRWSYTIDVGNSEKFIRRSATMDHLIMENGLK